MFWNMLFYDFTCIIYEKKHFITRKNISLKEVIWVRGEESLSARNKNVYDSLKSYLPFNKKKKITVKK